MSSSSLATSSGVAVLPGDDVTEHVLDLSQPVVLGMGLVQEHESLVATTAGVLRFGGQNKYWVETTRKRYVPSLEDIVIGTVRARHGESFSLDIRARCPAVLPGLAFDGASKRNKPNLAVGALVLARVVTANKDMEPELSCMALHGTKKDWVTGLAQFGELHGGMTLNASYGLCRSYVFPSILPLSFMR